VARLRTRTHSFVMLCILVIAYYLLIAYYLSFIVVIIITIVIIIISDVNLPVKYVCGKKTDFLPVFVPVKYDRLNSYQYCQTLKIFYCKLYIL